MESHDILRRQYMLCGVYYERMMGNVISGLIELILNTCVFVTFTLFTLAIHQGILVWTKWRKRVFNLHYFRFNTSLFLRLNLEGITYSILLQTIDSWRFHSWIPWKIIPTFVIKRCRYCNQRLIAIIFQFSHSLDDACRWYLRWQCIIRQPYCLRSIPPSLHIRH